MSETVELWLRSMSSWTVGRQGTFVDDLEVLTARGVVDGYGVKMWDRHVPVDGDLHLTRRERRVRERVDAARSWADEQDYDLPAFSRTTTAGTFQGVDREGYEATVLPLAVLFGYEGGDLQWVAPYSDGDDHVSVQDRLDELASRLPEGDADAAPVTAE
jgi:hypothetical protein